MKVAQRVYVISNPDVDSAGALALSYLVECLKHAAQVSLHRSIDQIRMANGDIVIFHYIDSMTQLEAVSSAKMVRVGLFDPKPSQIKYLHYVNFLIVSSREQREVFLPYCRNIFTFLMFPNRTAPVGQKCNEKNFRLSNDAKGIKIVYHGNLIHLNSIWATLIPALCKVSEYRNVIFIVVYNIEKHGLWKFGRPDNDALTIIDYQWHSDWAAEILDSDNTIGVVPFYTPVMRVPFINRLTYRLYLGSKLDHLLSFKSSTNPGRILVFADRGVPVIAESVPSSESLIEDGFSGRLVLSAEGWRDAFLELVDDKEKRKLFGSRLKNVVDIKVEPLTIAKDIMRFFDSIEVSQGFTERLDIKRPSYIRAFATLIVRKLRRHSR